MIISKCVITSVFLKLFLLHKVNVSHLQQDTWVILPYYSLPFLTRHHAGLGFL